VVADLIWRSYGRRIRYIADVAGGQGELSSLLRHRFGYDAEVVDPRGWRIKGVPGREEEFDPAQASYYDLVVGVHPDQATRAVALAALYTRTLLVPCCNFWERSRRLGTIALVEAIEHFYSRYQVRHRRVELELRGPKNIALLTGPPARQIELAEVVLPPAGGRKAGGHPAAPGWQRSGRRESADASAGGRGTPGRGASAVR
jgi:hypothetical protein